MSILAQSPSVGPSAAEVGIRVLAANVYLFSIRRQNRFLAETLAPALPGLASDFEDFRFWFDRFDARGPHLFLLFSAAETGIDALRARLEALITGGLEALAAEGPADDTPGAARIEELHAACRGKTLCAADRQPGLAADGSFVLDSQPADAYPFHLTPAHGPADTIWPRISALTNWTLEQRAAAGDEPATAAALRFMAGLDRQLRASDAEPADYWHHHLKSLMHELDALLEEKGEPFVDALAAGLGDANRRVFQQVWQWAETAEPAWDGLPALVSDVTTRGPGAWRLLREIVHGALKQLGLVVPKHLPILIFGWLQYRRPADGSGGDGNGGGGQ